MNNTDSKIFFNFSYFALRLLGKGLYSNPWTAIAELVANGLDARATQVKILIDMSDKQHSVVEIFDNGTGMSYEDLAEKYVLIGKNKRDDTLLDEQAKKSIMGRKGIGKLAALYLSNKYYLLSKTNAEDSAWCFDMSAGQDSEIPSLDRINPKALNISAVAAWNSFKTGTMVKLENVDMTNIGIQSIEGLKARLSDYYLLDSIDGKIELAVKYRQNAPIVFSPIEKNIAFKNFYAIFDNSEFRIRDRIQHNVFFPSSFDEISEKRRSTVVLDNSAYTTEGERQFLLENGQLTKEKIPYQLTGWIGIHSSIKKEDAQINDPTFLKNKAYKSTQLRLYVRKKLAVEDFLPYIKNTQAFANYIEGEISFDILDDNELADIATSNRQGFAEDDERVALLIELVKPIVNALITQRVKIGQEIKQEEESLKKQAEDAKRIAEEEQKKAEEKQREAEEQYKEAKLEAKKYHAQSNTIFSTVTEDQKSFSAKTHLVKTNALTIRNNISTLAKKIGINSYRELSAISIASDKILSALKYSAVAKFNIEDEFITEDLFRFCDEYLSNVLNRQYYDINISTSITGSFCTRFRPQYISLLFDNLLSNSEKSNSTTVSVIMSATDDGTATIIVEDNGDGFCDIDIERAFEFGFSNTGGTGIGLYNVKTVIEKMNGHIQAENNHPKGARFVISLR